VEVLRGGFKKVFHTLLHIFVHLGFRQGFLQSFSEFFLFVEHIFQVSEGGIGVGQDAAQVGSVVLVGCLQRGTRDEALA